MTTCTSPVMSTHTGWLTRTVSTPTDTSTNTAMTTRDMTTTMTILTTVTAQWAGA